LTSRLKKKSSCSERSKKTTEEKRREAKKERKKEADEKKGNRRKTHLANLKTQVTPYSKRLQNRDTTQKDKRFKKASAKNYRKRIQRSGEMEKKDTTMRST